MINRRKSGTPVSASTFLLAALCLPLLVAGGALAGTPYQGYTFSATGSTAYLQDMNGLVLHAWSASGPAQTCAYLLEDGSALFPIQNAQCTSPHHDGAYPNGRFQIVDWDGNITWDYRFCDATGRAGYDVEPLPNGNILIPTDGTNIAKIFEVQPTGSTTGQVVWSCQLPDSLAGGTTYMNSVSYNPELDRILIDMQEPLRRLVVIDHATGQVIKTYRVGNTGRVHAAIWVHKYFLGTDTVLPDCDAAAMRLNNLLVVYNGGDQVVEFTQAGVRTTIPFAYQDHEGSVQRLPNGNTLVTKGGYNIIRELDDSGAVVGSITAPGAVQRAYRWGPSYGGVAQLWPSGLGATAAAPVRFIYDRAAEAGTVSLDQGGSAPLNVRVYTVNGAKVSETAAHGSTASFSTERLLTGVYFVRVDHAGGSFHTRFVKVR